MLKQSKVYTRNIKQWSKLGNKTTGKQAKPWSRCESWLGREVEQERRIMGLEAPRKFKKKAVFQFEQKWEQSVCFGGYFQCFESIALRNILYYWDKINIK